MSWIERLYEELEQLTVELSQMQDFLHSQSILLKKTMAIINATLE